MNRLLMLAGLLLALGLAPLAGHSAGTANPRVQFQTNKGSFVVELYADKAPKSVENFLGYAGSGFYVGTTFHRVIAGFVAQGGGFALDEQRRYRLKETGDPIQNEADNGLRNDRGTLAMARTMDPHSATSQFYINLVNNDSLNHSAKTERGWGYAVFGRVVEGMESVDAMAKVNADRNGMPAEPIIIEKVKILDN